ncbi:MAG: alpha/beta hydrolase [Anaerolineales bacterium]|jgi:carboxylesterase
MSKQPFGILLLHGLYSTPDNFRDFVPELEKLGLPYKAPTLTGHGAASPEAIIGVKWEKWIEDSEKSLSELMEEAEKAIIIGHSLGGMIAMNLSIDHKEKIDSIIIAGSSTRSADPLGPGAPLHFLAPILIKLLKKWNWPPIYTDQELAKNDPAYRWVPMVSFVELFEFMKTTEERLPEVTIPILIMHSRIDSLNSPNGAKMLYDTISTPDDQKQLLWFEKTNHSMFLDCEKEKVNQAVLGYIQERSKMKN